MTRTFCCIRIIAALVGVLAAVAALPAADEPAPTGPQQVVHRVTGLFSRDREADLRKALEKLEGIKLISVEFDYAEATFEYDAAKAFPGAKPEQVVERFDEILRNATRSTFGVKPRCDVPRDKLTRIDFLIGGLDCKACCLYVYEVLAQQEGVEQATASFKDGWATALIDPAKTDRSKLEAVLQARDIPLTQP